MFREISTLQIELNSSNEISERAIEIARHISNHQSTTAAQHEHTNALLEMLDEYLGERLQEIHAKALNTILKIRSVNESTAILHEKSNLLFLFFPYRNFGIG